MAEFAAGPAVRQVGASRGNRSGAGHADDRRDHPLGEWLGHADALGQVFEFLG